MPGCIRPGGPWSSRRMARDLKPTASGGVEELAPPSLAVVFHQNQVAANFRRGCRLEVGARFPFLGNASAPVEPGRGI